MVMMNTSDIKDLFDLSNDKDYYNPIIVKSAMLCMKAIEIKIKY